MKKIQNKIVFAFIVGYHLIAVALIPAAVTHFSWSAVALFLITFSIGGISITAGYHRLYAHRSFSAHPVFEWAVLIGSTLAFQWSALVWSHDHRLHHKHVDTEKDPYSIKKGFWYAHILWLFYDQKPFQEKLVRDLAGNRSVMFQHKHYLALAITTNLSVFAIACLFLHPLAALGYGVLFRLLAIHHCTWFINSLAHTIGSKTYARELSAVDNAFLAFVTFGEGYHNYHHAFANDYRNGIRWYHFDPTKWLVWTASKLKLTWGLRKVDEIRIQRSLIQKDRNLILERLREERDELAEELAHRLDHLADAFEKTAQSLNDRLRLLRESGRENARNLRREIIHLQNTLRDLWKKWIQTTTQVIRQYQLVHHH